MHRDDTAFEMVGFFEPPFEPRHNGRQRQPIIGALDQPRRQRDGLQGGILLPFETIATPPAASQRPIAISAKRSVCMACLIYKSAKRVLS